MHHALFIMLHTGLGGKLMNLVALLILYDLASLSFLVYVDNPRKGNARIRKHIGQCFLRFDFITFRKYKYGQLNASIKNLATHQLDSPHIKLICM